MSTSPTIGRFAPSPTGELHFGSLVAAVGSYLQARHGNGQWRVRIEDLDPPREVPGSARRILTDLERFGLVPDGPVLRQSTMSPLLTATTSGSIPPELKTVSTTASGWPR